MKMPLIVILATLLASSLVGVCQENGKPEPDKPTQTETKTSATLPSLYTITDLKGRSMEGTILSKTDTEITFERSAGKKKFVIPINTLSIQDQTFISTLVSQGKKSILFVSTETTYLKYSKETIENLQKSGYEVTIGISDSRSKSINMPPGKQTNPKVVGLEGVKAIFITDPAETDSYKIVWVPRLTLSDVNKVPIQGTIYTKPCLHENLVAIFNHRDSKKLPVVVRCEKNKSKSKEYFLKGIPPQVRFVTKSFEEPNYCSIDHHWMYYWDLKGGSSQKLYRDKAINSVGKLLDL